MCEYAEKLVAWLDGELTADAAALVKEHLIGCAECPKLIAAYKEVSAALADYCDTVATVPPVRRTGRKVLAGATAAAAGLLLLSIFPRASERQMNGLASPETTVPTITSVQIPAPAPKLSRRHIPKTLTGAVGQPSASATLDMAGAQNAIGPFAEVEIAIPAEAIFPPGAIPEGVQFVAAISIGTDGAAQSIRLRPY